MQGNWQTSDPLGYPDGWNNFAYVNNHVTSSIDWMGGWELVVDGTPRTGTTSFPQSVNLLSGVDEVKVDLQITPSGVSSSYTITATITYYSGGSAILTGYNSSTINVSINSSTGEISASGGGTGSSSISYGATGHHAYSYSISSDKKSIYISGSYSIEDLNGSKVAPPSVNIGLKAQE